METPFIMCLKIELRREKGTRLLSCQALNGGQTGFYRVVYDEASRAAIMKALPSMAETDRVGLISDAFACGAAGYAQTTAALELLSAYSDAKETSYVVWSEMASGLGGVTSSFFEQPDDVVESLRAFGADLFAPLVERLGWEPAASAGAGGENTPGDEEEDSYQTSLLRQLAVSRALAFEHPATVAEARRRFDAYLAGDLHAVPADLKGAVFASALRQGGAEELATLKALYAAAESSLEESTLLGAMGAGARDKDTVLAALQFNMTDAVRIQDGGSIVGGAARSRVGRRVVWDWVRENWDAVDAKFGGGGVSSGLTRVIGASCSGLCTEEDAAAIEAFYLPKKIEGAERTVSQVVESVRARTARLARDAAPVAAWLKK